MWSSPSVLQVGSQTPCRHGSMQRRLISSQSREPVNRDCPDNRIRSCRDVKSYSTHMSLQADFVTPCTEVSRLLPESGYVLRR